MLYFQVLVLIQYCSLLVKIVTLYALGDDDGVESLLISPFSFLIRAQRYIRWLLRRGPTSSHSEQRS